MTECNAYGHPRPRIAFLGLGTMGAPMARNLVRTGRDVCVWNRTPGPAAALEEDGAKSAPTPREAASGAEIVVTMLSDADAVLATAVGPNGFLSGARPGCIWVQMSTIGIAGTEHCAQAARAAGVKFVDAPVSGSKGPAEDAKLVILASGDETLLPSIAPLFDAIGGKTLWLGNVGAGTRFKIVVNAWLFYMMQGAAEITALARSTGVSMDRFADFLQDSPLGAPAAVAKLRKLQREDYSAEFSLQWALKDLKLALASADSAHAPMPAAKTIAAFWEHCVDAGYGKDDVIGVARELGTPTPA